MKAVRYSSFGGPDVLEVVDVDTPRPGPGEITVRVAGAGVNQLDTKIRSGTMPTGVPAFPLGTGFDASGTVLEVGDGVGDVTVGDLVFGTGRDTMAEVAVLTQWAGIPTGVDPVEAGGWGVATETAGRLLTELGLTAGTILVSGASGGVGTAIVQFAVARGLTVIGTASARNQEYLTRLGAVPVVYGSGLVDRVSEAAPNGVDGALDISGAGVIPELVTLVGDASRVISISDFSAPSLGARVSTGAARTTDPRDGFAEAAALPGFSLPVERRFALDEIAEAHRHAEGGHTVGKLVVTP
ncbi:NADP-dependent oxidoreductase [Herbiconiux sp. VKM Ac-2851]|uniref:NADP-dependent oxidoreductase n=1 Tax=Herbiconiux sp. VKM Ac-2851 TaxID=2739025 RepID=UPI00156695D5|nr:NADP-dependent oxidoreductase [Herbiconiux sp. VKM Ac-2851]NQX37023.1 NADP-dependent oxidoreductase [Herbiconiux sp. VKM Ac-2851]